MPGRKYQAGSGYRYGFNGKENDKDISEGGQDYGMRIYDVRLGRFFSVDPLTQQFAMLTPFQFASNNPILIIDIDGLEGGKPPSLTFNVFDVKNTWVNGPRITANIRATVQLKVLDLTTVKSQKTGDYKAYLLGHKFFYKAVGYDYQYMAYDQNGNPAKKEQNGAIASRTFIGGEVAITVRTSEIKSLDEIGDNDYVIILADNVVSSNEKPIIGHTIGQVSLINMKLLETDQKKRKKTTAYEIFHQFGPGDRYSKNDDGTGTGSGTENLMDMGDGVRLDAKQASDVISNFVENVGAEKAKDKRFNNSSKAKAKDAVKKYTHK